MQLTLLLVAAFAAFTSAVHVRGYPAYNCGGTQQWICPNVASKTCCKFPVRIRSMYWSLPSKAGGIGYNGLVCTGVRYKAIKGLTSSCWNYPSPSYPVRSAKWVAGLFTRHVARAESQLEEREENCVDASVFAFTKDGQTTTLNVPSDSVEQVVDLAAKEDYDGLTTLGQDWMTVAEDLDLDTPPSETHDSSVEG